MVRLSKIYTRVGDRGTTMLGDGSTVPKHSPRVSAYGEVDEANAAIGLVSCEAGRARGAAAQRTASMLRRIRNDMFDVGADLCVPFSPAEPAGSRLRITPADVTRLEAWIDELNEPLKPLNSFILPGGSELAARLHLARTITRRAERAVSALIEADPLAVNTQALIYLNRLSDLLFVMARAVNHDAGDGPGDVLWVPGGGDPGGDGDATSGGGGGR